MTDDASRSSSRRTRLRKRTSSDSSDEDNDNFAPLTPPASATKRKRLHKKISDNDVTVLSDDDNVKDLDNNLSDNDGADFKPKPAPRKRRLQQTFFFSSQKKVLWPTWNDKRSDDKSDADDKLGETDDEEDEDDDLDGFIVHDDDTETSSKRRNNKIKSDQRLKALLPLSSQEDDSLLSADVLLRMSPETLQRTIAPRSPRIRSQSASSSSQSPSMKKNKPQLPAHFSMSSAATLENAFEGYIQYLASAACDPTFIRSVINEKDEYFLPSVERMDRDLSVVKGVCDSSAWRPQFRAALEERPYMKESNGSSRGSDCEACHRPNHTATVIIRLYGPTYDPTTFEVLDPHEDDNEDNDLVFYVGRHCAKKSLYYHWLNHCRLLLYQRVGHEILKLRETMSAEAAVQSIISNDAFLRKLRSDYENQKDKVVEFLQRQ